MCGETRPDRRPCLFLFGDFFQSRSWIFCLLRNVWEEGDLCPSGGALWGLVMLIEESRGGIWAFLESCSDQAHFRTKPGISIRFLVSGIDLMLTINNSGSRRCNIDPLNFLLPTWGKYSCEYLYRLYWFKTLEKGTWALTIYQVKTRDLNGF